jgi:hypothetical protein
LFRVSITPKYAHTPIATAITILMRFLIGILIAVLSDIFINNYLDLKIMPS